MASRNKDSTFPTALPTDGWSSLVHRSLEAGRQLKGDMPPIAEGFLRSYHSLDDFLSGAPQHLMFWFFQRRDTFLSQKTMTKWSRDRLDSYVLLPALPGFVTRAECFFVSHFWHAKNDPDPRGTYLWLYHRDLGLQTMSGLIRNSGFAWFYPPFEPRLWILYEIAEYSLTNDGVYPETEDSRDFVAHVKEMMEVGVSATLDKHGYRCTYDRDKAFLTSWLELLVLLRKLLFDLVDLRRLMDHFTWSPSVKTYFVYTLNGLVEVRRYEGVLAVNGERYTFTPFPEWVSYYRSSRLLYWVCFVCVLKPGNRE